MTGGKGRIQKGIDLGGAIDSKLQTAIRNAIAGAAVNQLGGNVNAQNLMVQKGCIKDLAIIFKPFIFFWWIK